MFLKLINAIEKLVTLYKAYFRRLTVFGRKKVYNDHSKYFHCVNR